MFKVALIGQTNVGKSTLFNRLIEEKKSIISSIPGTTRDRIYGNCFWRGTNFTLIDLGGIKKEAVLVEDLEKEIQKQIEIAINKANLILFLLDGQEGIKKENYQIAQKLKKLKKEIVLVINKTDNPSLRAKFEENDFRKLGLGRPFFVSAANGSGTGDLLDEIVKRIKKMESKDVAVLQDRDIWQPGEKITKIAIIGKTNVGKSTLVNSILGEERVVVTPQPHTTREPVDTFLEHKGRTIILVDTAGLRKKAKIKSVIEKIGLEKSLRTIHKAEIVFFLLDLLEKVSYLDRKIAGLIKREKRAVILVINKFDLAKLSLEKYLHYYQNALPSLWWVPIIFISAKEKINLEKLLDLAWQTKRKMTQSFNEQELITILKTTIKEYKFKEKFWSRTSIKQKTERIPIFLLQLPKLTRREMPPREAQINLLEKKIREEFALWGIPIEIRCQSSPPQLFSQIIESADPPLAENVKCQK